MTEPLLHTRTKTYLQALQNDPPHAVLLSGVDGVGKRTVAEWWAGSLTKPDHIRVVSPDEKGTIGIDTVRGLYRDTRSRQAHRQVVIVDHAESMGIDAQNAFLKLLEEPRQGVTFILTVATPELLLPTIASRLQIVPIHRHADKDLQQFIADRGTGITPQELAQLQFVAQGRPGIAAQLLDDPEAFTARRSHMQQAKQLLSLGQYERLAMVAELSKDRSTAVTILEAMAHMASLQLRTTFDARWATIIDAVQECLARLQQNGNLRIQLTRLFTSY